MFSLLSPAIPISTCIEEVPPKILLVQVVFYALRFDKTDGRDRLQFLFSLSRPGAIR